MARIACLFSLFATLFVSGSVLAASTQNCIVAGADNSQLTGFVSQEIYQGKKYWMLTTEKPVCAVSPGSESPAASGLPESFIRLQVAEGFNEADLQQHSGLRIQLTGHVFSGQPGTHVTAMLIDISTIQAAP